MIVVAAIALSFVQARSAAKIDSGDSGERLRVAREGFQSPRDADRRAAARALLRELSGEDVDAALAAIGEWPPTAALLLRETLAASGGARATLVERATRAEGGALARALLVDAFVARASAAAPFRAASRSGGDDDFPLSDRGAWFERPADARAGWTWYEIDDVLTRDGVLERTLVPTSDCADLLVGPPIAMRVPVEGWLGVAAARASLRCVTLATGAWIVSAERAPRFSVEREGRGARTRARVLEVEARLLDGELAAAARLADVRRGVVAGDLLRRVGIEGGSKAVGRGEPRELKFASGLALARAARGDGAAPAIDGADAVDPVVAAFLRMARARSSTTPAPSIPRPRDETRPAPPGVDESVRILQGSAIQDRRDPASLRDRPSAEVRAIVARLIEVTRGHSDRVQELRAATVQVVDAIAGRFADDPLLGGQLADLLKREAAAPAIHDDERRALEAWKRELFALDGGTRPPTRLLQLPAGAAR